MKDRRHDDKEGGPAPSAPLKPERVELRMRSGLRVYLRPGVKPEDIFGVEKETLGGMKTKGNEEAGEAKGGRGMSLEELASRCCKTGAALKVVQKGLGLHVPADGVYSEGYCRFLEKVVALQALHVSRATVADLFEKEKQILRLLHVDSLGNSPTWYLDACALPDAKKGLETRLLLSGYDLGFRLDATAVQDALDFGSREKELFKGADMGEDVRKLLVDYVRMLAGIRKTVTAEIPVIRNALVWAKVLEG